MSLTHLSCTISISPHTSSLSILSFLSLSSGNSRWDCQTLNPFGTTDSVDQCPSCHSYNPTTESTYIGRSEAQCSELYWIQMNTVQSSTPQLRVLSDFRPVLQHNSSCSLYAIHSLCTLSPSFPLCQTHPKHICSPFLISPSLHSPSPSSTSPLHAIENDDDEISPLASLLLTSLHRPLRSTLLSILMHVLKQFLRNHNPIPSQSVNSTAPHPIPHTANGLHPLSYSILYLSTIITFLPSPLTSSNSTSYHPVSFYSVLLCFDVAHVVDF